MKFLLTHELGRLAKWLRILGFDTEYFKEENPASLIIKALREERIILTRNQHLPLGRGVKIVVLKEEKFKSQIKELIKTLELKLNPEHFFNRCTICNQILQSIEKEKVKDKVPEYVYLTQEDFFVCPECRRIYWQGTHWGNVQKILDEVTD